jgi:hypothetical protein
MRIAAQTAVEILLTVLLTLLFVGAVSSIDTADPGAAFFQDGPALVFGVFWIGLILWGLSVVIGNVIHRNRRPGARIAHNLVSALIAAIVNTIVFVVLAFTAGGWAALLVAFAIVAGLAFLVAAAIAVPLTHRFLFRPRTAASTPSASAAPAPASTES